VLISFSEVDGSALLISLNNKFRSVAFYIASIIYFGKTYNLIRRSATRSLPLKLVLPSKCIRKRDNEEEKQGVRDRERFHTGEKN
jgi:hypothetical protein